MKILRAFGKTFIEAFRLDEIHRAQLRAELDAYYARLYGLTRDELRYTPLARIRKKSTVKISLAKLSAWRGD